MWPKQTKPVNSGFPQPAKAIAPTGFPVVEQMDQATLDHKIMEWIALEKQLEDLKAREMELRLEISQSHLFDPSKEKGTQTVHLGNDCRLKCRRVQYTKVENGNYQAAAAVIQLRNLGGEAAKRADRVLKFNATLSETVYKECRPEEKAIIDPLLTTKPGKPTLEFLPPKSD